MYAEEKNILPDDLNEFKKAEKHYKLFKNKKTDFSAVIDLKKLD
jgi:hypothetical protein